MPQDIGVTRFIYRDPPTLIVVPATQERGVYKLTVRIQLHYESVPKTAAEHRLQRPRGGGKGLLTQRPEGRTRDIGVAGRIDRDASADISAESDVTVGTKALPVEGNTRRIELCDQYPEATLQQVVSELSRYIGVAHCVHGDAEAGVVCAVTVEVGGVEEFGTSRVELAHIHIR